jgi:uncharacterized protein
MEQEEVLRAAKLFAHSVHTTDRSGHDWPHIERVAKWSSRLAVAEGADPFVCELAALIHDVGDEKLNDSKEAGELKVRSWLDSQPIADAVRQHVWDIISTMSFNGGVNAPMRTIEGEVVQDADRLDAIGAIGIARTFVYAGSRGHSMYDPELPSRMSMSASGYRNGKQTAINHFYEKLLLLKDRMNTESGRRAAEERHTFLESYLKQFLEEWNG